MEDIKVIYEDKYIVLAEKPVGVLSEESGNKRSMPLLLKEYFAAKNERADIFTLHRLDKNVGGLMIFARNPKSASILAGNIASRDFEKKYLAVIYGRPEPESGEMRDLLLHDASHNKTYIVDRMRKGVREAVLTYETLESGEENGKTLTLVRVTLGTGRTHQIRVQFASRKLPLVGDGRYGSADGGDTPALCSHCLAFDHPKTGKRMEFTSKPPDTYPFSLFKTY